MPEIKAAGAVCYLRDGKHLLFLLLRSAKQGEWGPPKGKAEPGESPVETATRELCEEAGLRRIRFASGFEHNVSYNVKTKNGNKSKQVVYYLCELDSDEIRLSHEHTEVHLATLSEVETLVPHENLKDVFRKASAFIQKNAGRSE